MSNFDNELKVQTAKLQLSKESNEYHKTDNTLILSDLSKPIHIDSNDTNQTNPEKSIETKQRKMPSRIKSYKLLKYALITVAMLCITYYFLSPAIHNTFARTTLSPVKYYQKVEKQNLDKQIHSLSNIYGNYQNTYNKFIHNGMGADTTLLATIDSSITKNLGLEKLENVNISMLSMGTNRKVKSSIALTSNQEKVTSFDTFIDLEQGDLFLQVPELSEAYLKSSFKEIFESICIPMDTRNTDKIYPIFKNNPLSKQLLNDLLTKYAYITIDELKDVTIENNDKVVVEGITSYYTKITINVEQETALIIFEKILNMAKLDTELINLLVGLKICTIDEYNTAINSALNSINDTIKYTSAKEPTHNQDIINMSIWVDNEGTINGRTILYNQNNKTILSGYKTAREGANVGLETWFNSNRKDIIRTTGKLHLNKKGISGDMKLITTSPNMESPEIFNLSIKDAQYKKDEGLGYLNGKLTITSESLSAVNVSILSTRKDKQQKISVDVTQAGVNLVSIAMLLKLTPYESFDLPTNTNKIYAANTQFEEYVTTKDFTKYGEKIKDKIDIDKLNSIFNELLTNYMD